MASKIPRKIGEEAIADEEMLFKRRDRQLALGRRTLRDSLLPMDPELTGS